MSGWSDHISKNVPAINGKRQCAIGSIMFLLFAFSHYNDSRSILTDLPREMILAKTSGTLQSVNFSKYSRLFPYRNARLQVMDKNGRTRNFEVFRVSDAPGRLAKFRELQPGSQLDIIYRAEHRGWPLPPGEPARIMEMSVNGFQIWSLAESAATSASHKKGRMKTALIFAIVGACLLVVAIFLYLKHYHRWQRGQ